MKSTNAVKSFRVVMAVALALVMGLHLAVPSRAYSDAAPQILGKTYGEWSAQWWQWAITEPTATNPMLHSDADSAYSNIAALNQKGPVWFLAGTALDLYGTPVTRTVDIPFGKYIFFPIINVFQGNGPLPNPIQPIVTEPEERENLYGYINTFGSNFTCTLDGVPVAKNPDTPIVRTQSPAFTLTFFDNPIYPIEYGYVAGDYFPTVSDGYWVMLQPLTAGEHTLHFATGDISQTGPPSQDVTYILTVEGKSQHDHKDNHR